MCGRYANFVAEQELLDAFEIAAIADDARLAPRWNIGPTQMVQIVRPARLGTGEPSFADAARGELAPSGMDVGTSDLAHASVHAATPDPAPSHAGRELAAARWGLVPGWAKDPSIGVKMFNARIETIAEKPSFRSAFAQRRCIVPASGYYEWRTDAGGKQPFFIQPADGGVLAFAGIFELWKDRTDPDADWLVSCSIVTTAARDELRDIHDRQPVMLTRDAWDVWLERESTPDDLFAAAADAGPDLAWHPVAKDVGNIRNEGPRLAEPVEE